MPKGIYDHSHIVPWNKGLTKHSHPSLASSGKKVSQALQGRKHKSNCKCACCADHTGRVHSPSTIHKLKSSAKARWDNASQKQRKKWIIGIRSANKARGKTYKKYWKNLSPSEKSLFISNCFDSAKIFPNKAERALFKIINKILPGKYTLNVASRTRINGLKPDIIHKKKKIVIELLGDYWHHRRNGNTRSAETRKKKNKYKKCGYRCLVVWERELKKLESLTKKIIKFHNQ